MGTMHFSRVYVFAYTSNHNIVYRFHCFSLFPDRLHTLGSGPTCCIWPFYISDLSCLMMNCGDQRGHSFYLMYSNPRMMSTQWASYTWNWVHTILSKISLSSVKLNSSLPISANAFFHRSGLYEPLVLVCPGLSSLFIAEISMTLFFFGGGPPELVNPRSSSSLSGLLFFG